MGAPDPLVTLTRAFRHEPASVARGTERTRMSAALWRMDVPGRIELAADALADAHIVSLCVGGRHRSTYWGDGRVRIDGASGPGNLNIVPAGERPRAVQACDGVLAYLHIYVPQALVGELVPGHDSPDDPGAVEIIDPRCSRDPVVERIGREVLAEMRGSQPLSRLRVDALGLELAIQLLRRHSNLAGTRAVGAPLERGRLAPWQVRRATDYLMAHLDDDVSLAELAAAVRLSPFHFARAFKRSTGLTPQRFFMERRVDRARELLADTNMGLAEIALACGFAGQSHFTTAFKRHAGVTPGAWRAAVRN